MKTLISSKIRREERKQAEVKRREEKVKGRKQEGSAVFKADIWKS